ncbi:hypothetical protein DL96DRAFT_656888 [Flagelloscypha sp. PMI_526]|nr:hypothetical protein DL96DRAFT_656888 [Flagelloscypha sp. PMI_526]
MESRKAQNSKQLRWQIPELSPLDRHSATWAHLKKRFLSIGWQHPHKPMPRVRAILKISHQEDALEKFFLYRDEVDAEIGVRTDPPGNTKLRFHGTAVRCLLGETPRHCKPCSHPSCSLCSIIKASFCVAKCGLPFSTQLEVLH